MTLFIAIANFEYEGSDVIGVFDTAEKAQEACDNHKYTDGSVRGDDRDVIEFELNKPIIIEI